MTGPVLFPYAPPDGIQALITWLSGIGNADPSVGEITAANVGPDRDPSSPLPFFMVSRPVITDDKLTQNGVYVVHTFATAPNRRAALKAAHDAAMLAHRRILVMGPPFGGQREITLPSGQVVQCDGVDPKEGPVWVEYSREDKSIQCFVAEYDIPWRYVAAP